MTTTSTPATEPVNGENAATSAPASNGSAAVSGEGVATAPTSPATPGRLPVREGEDPWTDEELDEVRVELEDEIARLIEQIDTSNAELVGLLRDGSDGAGRDPADVGSTNFERDHEISLANNARELLDQSRLALKHIAKGTYGICDNCGQPIGKGRLQAFPRATLCVSCKQREERR